MKPGTIVRTVGAAWGYSGLYRVIHLNLVSLNTRFQPPNAIARPAPGANLLHLARHTFATPPTWSYCTPSFPTANNEYACTAQGALPTQAHERVNEGHLDYVDLDLINPAIISKLFPSGCRSTNGLDWRNPS